MQGETRFKQRVQKDLKRLPHSWFIKTQERSRRGVPDILGCVSGVFIAIELKDEGKEATKLQQVYLDKITDAGGIAFVSTPDRWSLQFLKLREISDGKSS